MEISEQELAELKAGAERAKELEGKAKAADDFKADMLRFKAEKVKLEETLAAQSAEKEAADRAKLAEQGQYKTLLEKSEAEKAELKKRADSALESVTHFVRAKSVETEAAKAGIRPEAMSDLRLLGLDSLEVKREGNEIKVLGSEDFIAQQKKLRPHWFAEVKVPGFDNGKGGNASGGGTSDLAELAKKDPAAYKERLKAIVAGKA
jgi:hypothetical protein